MILLELLIGFLKVGLFSFGGAYAAIPLIRDVVVAYNWMTDEELVNMIAVSESTPGPIMVNVATYVGSNIAGISGAFVATFAVVLPAFVIIILILSVLNKALNNKYVQAVMNGLKPCITGIILATGAYMLYGNIIKNADDANFSWQSLVIMLILYAVIFIFKKVFEKKLSPILMIVLSAVCGIVLF